MTLKAQEHYDLIAQFERDFRLTGRCIEKEPKEMWAKGSIYQHGETNQQFLVYRHGYAFGKCVGRTEANQ